MPKEWEIELVHGQLLFTGSNDQNGEFVHSPVASVTLLNYKFLKGKDSFLLMECISTN